MVDLPAPPLKFATATWIARRFAGRSGISKREPALPPVGLDFAGGEGGVGGQAAAEGVLVHPEDRFRHLPRGKPPQLLLVRLREGLPPDVPLHSWRGVPERIQVVMI